MARTRYAILLAADENAHGERLTTSDVEAKIIAKACTAPPERYTRWMVTLVAEECAVILEECVSRSTVSRIMKQNEIRPTGIPIGASRCRRIRTLWQPWSTALMFTSSRMVLNLMHGGKAIPDSCG